MYAIVSSWVLYGFVPPHFVSEIDDSCRLKHDEAGPNWDTIYEELPEVAVGI